MFFEKYFAVLSGVQSEAVEINFQDTVWRYPGQNHEAGRQAINTFSRIFKHPQDCRKNTCSY